MLSAIKNLILDLIYRMLYYIEVALLSLLGYVERFFGLFAGTQRITYGNESTYLINVLLGNDAIGRAFWAMALLSIVLSFAFAIYMVAKKTIDFSGSVKQSVGQIMTGFFRGLLIILLLNFMVVSSITITNMLLDRVNYALIAAQADPTADTERKFTDEEYAQMAVILAQVANYNVNPTSEIRYNANACFNSVRAELLGLYVNGVFDYDYPVDEHGRYSWQGALKLLATAADLNSDLSLNEYNAPVQTAVSTICKELNANSGFYPVDTAVGTAVVLDDIRLDTTIFLATSMNAARSSRTASFSDPLRQSYLKGKRDYTSYSHVTSDFKLAKVDFFAAYISAIVLLYVMFNVIFNFMVRLFNIAMLYITSPFFASTMAQDDGEKFKSWGQAFVLQLFSGFGTVVAMRLYLMFIPVLMSSDLMFFIGSGTATRLADTMAKLIAVLGGGWAVMHASIIINGVLSGSSGMAAAAQDGAMRMTSGMALNRAARMAGGVAKWGVTKGVPGALDMPRKLVRAPGAAANATRNYLRGFTSPYKKWTDTSVGDMKRTMDIADTKAKYQDFKKQLENAKNGGTTEASTSTESSQPSHSNVGTDKDTGPVSSPALNTGLSEAKNTTSNLKPAYSGSQNTTRKRSSAPERRNRFSDNSSSFANYRRNRGNH